MLFPICAGIAVAAQELVLVVLGPQWHLAVGLVPWFASRWLPCRLPAHPAAGGRARRTEPVAGRPDGLHPGAGPAHSARAAIPVQGSMGDRRGCRGRGDAPLRLLSFACSECSGNPVGARSGERTFPQRSLPSLWRLLSQPRNGGYEATLRRWLCSGLKPSPECSPWHSAFALVRSRPFARSFGCV